MLECVLCERTFTTVEIAEGQYCLHSMVCGFCYAELQSKEHLCFGKPHDAQVGGRLGYNPSDEQCAVWCTDRVACRNIVIGENSDEN